jgi:hypothetical protein
MSQFWNALWENEEEFLESGEEEFRHGISFVAVSSIAEQYYCEYKIENEFALGEIATETKDSGTALHDELMPMEKIGRKEFAQLVSKKEPSLAVLGVWGSAGGLKVIGTPDHIVWSEGKPLWVVELKTTKGDPAPLWEDQENQVRIYGLLLDRMGFDCSRMKLAVVRLKSGELNDEEKKSWMQKISRALMEDGVTQLEAKYQGRMKVHLLNHDLIRAERAIALKAGYWLMQREPSSTESVGKCRACEYRDVCSRSLAKSVQTEPHDPAAH